MKRILLSLALLSAVAQTQAEVFTQAEEAALNIAFPETTYNFVMRTVGQFLTESGKKLSDIAQHAGTQVADCAKTAYDVVSRETAVAAQEPAAVALVDAAQYVKEMALISSHAIKSTAEELSKESAEMLVLAQEAAPHIPGMALEAAKRNKYTIALVALVAGSYGAYKLSTMKKKASK